MKGNLEIGRRDFLQGASLSAVGAGLLSTLPSSSVTAQPSWRRPTHEDLVRQQADREAAFNFAQDVFMTMDDLNAPGWISFFSEDVLGQDPILGDIPQLFGVSGTLGAGIDCSLSPAPTYEAFAAFIMSRVGRPGRFMKCFYVTGNINFGIVADLHPLGGSFFSVGVDLVSLMTIRNGKIVRRADYYDTAQLAAVDVNIVHANNTPRMSCLAGPAPGDTENASPEMLEFTHALSDALSSGQPGRVLPFFAEDALLIHPLLYSDTSPILSVGTGGYGPFNRGIEIRGRQGIARFLEAVLPLLPDGKNSTLRHVIGGPTGGGFEWIAGGLYSKQGIARTGISGGTSIDLFGGSIKRMNVKFDTLQMLPEQRAAVQKELAGLNLVA